MTPFSSSPRLQRRHAFFRRLRLYCYCSGTVLALIGVVYLFTGSSFFKISTITVVSGGAPLNQEDLIATLKEQVAARRGWLGTDNYLAWPTDLHYTAPQVSNIMVAKSFWNRSITITALPRERYAVWCSKDDTACYWVDPIGIAFEPAPIAEGQLVQTIFDNATSSVNTPGQSALPAVQFAAVKKIIDASRQLDLGLTSITLERNLQELHLTALSGTQILFSLRFDPEPAALPTLARFMQNPGLDKISYLNLTVENRAFVKYK